MSNHKLNLSYENYPVKKHALIKAITSCGNTPSQFAKKLGVGNFVVYRWLAQDFVAPPAHYCRKIEEITNGEVTCEQLRPDVFGPPLIIDETLEGRFKRCITLMNSLAAEIDFKKNTIPEIKKPRKK